MTPSETELIEKLKRGYEHFNGGDFDAAIALVHPDIELVPPGGQRALRGAEAMRAWMEPNAFEDQKIKPEEFVVSDESVLVHQVMRARGAGSGIQMEIELWAVWTFDSDGEFIRVQGFLPHEESDARRAAGLGG